MKILLTFLTCITCITGLSVFSVEATERTISVLAIWTVIPGRAVFPLFHALLIGLLDFFEFRLCLILVRIIDIGIRMIFSAEVTICFFYLVIGSITGYS